jgi:hypothetical protein
MNNDVVYIDLDRKRELRYGHKSLKQLVALTGKSLEELETAGFDDLELVEKFVYCGLLKDARENNESLTMEQMEDLIDLAPTYAHVIEKIRDAFAATFGAPPEGNQAAGESEKESHSTGTKASA